MPTIRKDWKRHKKFCDIFAPYVPRHLKVEQRAGQPAVATVEAEEDLPEKKQNKLKNNATRFIFFLFPCGEVDRS